MSEPTMLYRPREAINPEAWNLPLDTIIVDATEVEDAKAEGWLEAADAVEAANVPKAAEPHVPAEPGPYDSLLDAPVADIVPLLIEMSADELVSLRAAEVTGKTRKGLLAEIDKAIEAKAA